MDKSRLKSISVLALPIIGGMTSQNILNLVDTAMVGALGAPSLAAVGIASFVSFMAVASITGLSSAVQATAARRYGEGRMNELAYSLNGGILISICVGLPLTLVLWFACPWIYAALIDDPVVVSEGVPYLQARFLAIAFVGMNFSFRGFWSATNRASRYLRTLLLMHTINIFLNYCLIFGHFGFPELGTQGAGLGTTISVVIGCGIYHWIGFREARDQGFYQHLPNSEQLSSLLKLGIPSSIQQFLFAAGFTALFWIIGQIGTAELAVANVLINITLVAVLPGLGLGLAAATLSGQALGRGDADDALMWGWDVAKVASVVFFAFAIPVLLFTDPILAVFLHEPHLIQLGHAPLQLLGAGIIFDGVGLVLMNALLGVGAARVVAIVGVALQWLLFLPVAYLVGPTFGYGLIAIWLAMMAYRGMQAAIYAYYWRKQSWAQISI